MKKKYSIKTHLTFIFVLSLLLGFEVSVNAQTFNFDTDTDTEGWTSSNGTLAVAGGIMTLTPNVGTTSPGAKYPNALNPANGQYLHVLCTTPGPEIDRRIRFRVDSDGTWTTQNIIISANPQTYNFDLSSNPGWTGTSISDITIRFQSNNSTTASVENVSIDAIIFDNNPTLNIVSLERFDFSFFPNPTQDKINLKANEPINQVQVYTLLGKEVLNLDLGDISNPNVDISSLSVGIYNMKVSIGDSVGVVKVVKK
ncbi:T9SS type A sorting domain-containing protein [Flavivirga spongiicola]|uniref:T9SS type A sorting domain-containing protein n=1 Tax=Flavivirga spongiicola TaxID=421621 RepID=A0ABU7XYT8_9FLAO|nr:T9SS type A sorting domain-containing protein [Flavivirga sp. MEBiC05379]MDO5980029.1 T9SS type A sorting domain-containing protein [Flavivirga sp. MEBiC05379]